MVNQNSEETPEVGADQVAGSAPESEQPVASAESSTDAPGTETPESEQPAEQPEASTATQTLPELTLGSGAPADESELPEVEPNIRGKIDRFGVAMGTGRRKTSVARVRVKEGTGKFSINGRDLEEYFPTERDRLLIQAPLQSSEMAGKVDVWVRVNGGGTTGQAGAIVLGLSRALQVMNPSLHHVLSEEGYLTRDGRMVERKKYGFKKARKSFQFSKR